VLNDSANVGHVHCSGGVASYVLASVFVDVWFFWIVWYGAPYVNNPCEDICLQCGCIHSSTFLFILQNSSAYKDSFNSCSRMCGFVLVYI
jgi:hypothetical protein